MKKRLTILTLAAALLATPAGAAAATTCDLSSGVLTVSLGSSGDSVRMAVESNSIVVRSGEGSSIACTGGSPTTANTNGISINSAIGASNNDVFILDVGLYAPGTIDEPGTDEIEIFVNLRNGQNSELNLSTPASGGVVVFGTSGINPNAGNEVQPDTDIIHNDTVPNLSADGGTGGEVFSAQGGSGTGSPMTQPVNFEGGGGPDSLVGGNSRDTLFGAEGADIIEGYGGDDTVEGGLGLNDLLTGGEGDDSVYVGDTADRARGGPGVDYLSYDSLPSGVSADIAGTDFEDLAGTPFNDVLMGNDGANFIIGFGGDDRIDGRGGVDTLDGDSGADSLQARDGGPDTAACGPDADTVTTDLPGVDTLLGCETAIFPAPASSDPGPGSGGTPGGGTAALEAFGARTLVALALGNSRVPVRGPLSVRIANANGFDVTGTLGGKSTRRLSAAQRRRRIGLKPKSFAVPPNARKTTTLALPRALRRELARKGKLSLRLAATVVDRAGNSRTVKKTVTLRLRKPQDR
jgi:Ca2+-binding RTX toxin-like protein